MIRTLLAAACLVATTAPVASAHPGHHYEGGCTFVAVTADETSAGSDTAWAAVVTSSVVAVDAAGLPAAVPVGASCEVTVGAAAPATFAPGHGVGVAAGGDATTLTFAGNVPVTVCDVVTVAGETHRACERATPTEPAQPAVDVVDEILDAIWCCVDPMDLMYCPILASLSPGVPGVVAVNSEGDVHVVTQGLVWDCPPYAPEEESETHRWLVRVP